MTSTLPSGPSLLLARRELALAKREAELRRTNALAFYEPHSKQCAFHEAAMFHRRYARTGNRFGKSEMGAAEDVAFSLGFRPWYPEGDPRRTLGIPSHPTKGLIITTDWDKSTAVFTALEDGVNKGKLFKYIPASCYLGSSKNHSGAIDTIRIKHVSGGTSIIKLDTVKSFKQNPLGQESEAWDWIHIDEPIPEGMWVAVSRGLVDRRGKAWFTCTPLSEPWIDTKFSPDTENQSSNNDGFSHGNYWMMTGSMEDNPHNSPEAIADFIAELSPDEKECRIKGIPSAYSGIVYKEFQWNVHVLTTKVSSDSDVYAPPVGWTSWYEPPPTLTRRFAIDYHPRKPHHVLFIATDEYERQYVYAEIWLSCLMSELVLECRSILRGESTVPGLIDPLASTPNQVTDITPLDEVLRLGLPVIPATKDPHNGILAVKALLKARDRLGRPMLIVNPACRRFLFEISRGYIWDGETNKPVKLNDDAMENFYRLALQGLSYIEHEPSTALPNVIPMRALDDFFLDFSHLASPEESLDSVPSRHKTRYRA